MMKRLASMVARACPRACVLLTQLPVFVLYVLAVPSSAPAQELDFAIYSEPPRLFLNARRLRLLQREKERDSMRWNQFDALVQTNSRMPEPGFAYALHGRVAGQDSSCRKAIAWASKEANPSQPADLRQVALVADWCLPEGAERQNILTRVKPAIQKPPVGMQAIRSQALIGFAMADDEPKLAEETLRRAVQAWRTQVMAVIAHGDDPLLSREDLFASAEFLHAIRDNLRADLREGAGKWFEELAPRQLLRYYPQPWPAAENEYRIPAYPGAGDPDLREALFSRAAELAYVALDTNAQPSQFLQGWLMQDRFLLRSALGSPYELLWANPYQPGLSFHYMPDLYHANGELYVRGGWDEDASWFAYSKGLTQGFARGARIMPKPGTRPAPIDLGPAHVYFAVSGMRFETGWLPPRQEGEPAVEEVAFMVGLEPSTAYDVEVDDQGMFEARSDSGGILELRFLAGRKAGVRIKKAAPTLQ